jgi:hypothetical protein
MRTLITLAGMLFFGTAAIAQNSFGDIIGTLVDTDQEPIVGAIAMTHYGETMYRTQTDTDGKFRISGVPAGDYKVTFIYLGDSLVAPGIAAVQPNGYGPLGIVTFTEGEMLEGVTVLADDGSYKLTFGEAPVTTLSAKEIKFRPDKFSVKDMVVGTNSEVRKADNGDLVFRGARAGDQIYYIDGVKMTQVQNVPSVAIGYMQVYSGAIPAKYGDTNGGVIVIETKSYFDLLREYNNRPQPSSDED